MKYSVVAKRKKKAIRQIDLEGQQKVSKLSVGVRPRWILGYLAE